MSTFRRLVSSRSVQRALAVLGAASAAFAVACNEQKIITGFDGDITAPVITINKTNGDTMDVAQGLRYSVSAADNLGLKTISIRMSGGFTGQVDTTFRTAVTSTTLPITVSFPTNTTAGGMVQITATATDGNNNTVTVQDSIYLTNIDALIVTLFRPLPNAVTSGGKQVLVQVQATQKQGVRKIGWEANGIPGLSPPADSLLFAPPGLPDTAFFEDTLTVPAGLTSGSFTVNGFAEDSAGRRVASPAVTITIQSVAQDNTPPVVTFTVAGRVEVRDSINVRGTDPSGITKVGWLATDRNTGVVVGGDSVFGLSGTLTDVSETFNLNFGFTLFPQQVIIQAFAEDANGNRGEATTNQNPTGPIDRDTIIVVNGITRPLPAGGQVGDAIYNANLNELYLTNVALDRVEIFSVTDTAFVASVPVGSKPWGLALWPRDTLGANADTIVVANSGGTSFSIVDVQSRREARRHSLPNFLVEIVHLVRDPQTNAITGVRLESHDFSDRPEYLGMVCRPAGGTTCAADSIYAVYSTTPTNGQGSFNQRGSMRWENLTAATPESHFFWEHARPSSGDDTLFQFPDTIQITVDGGGRPGPQILLGAACFVSVVFDNLLFQDTTFVRNSGNFTHSFVGEGGNTAGANARVLAFDASAGLTSQACPGFGTFIPASTRDRENGVSPGRHVSDFISNTAIPVKSVATNFTGRTNLVRADSIYVLNSFLRLTGIMQSTGANAGMDLNFDHSFDADNGGTPAFGGTLDPNDRLAFAARPDPAIDVFDTYWYGRVTSIPVRDPITGPIRVAKLPSGEQLLIGVTARGVVTARLPAITNLPNYLTPGWQPAPTP